MLSMSQDNEEQEGSQDIIQPGFDDIDVLICYEIINNGRDEVVSPVDVK